MRTKPFYSQRLIIISLLIFSACNVVNNSDDIVVHEPIDWESGDIIEPANQEQLTEDELQKYLRDAERMAIHYFEREMSGVAEIPGSFVELVYNGLIHIVTSSHEKAVTVSDEYNIHTFGSFDYYNIHVTVDTVLASGWIDAWREGKTETGYPNLDDLTQQFDYTLAEYEERPQHTRSVAILHSDRLLNGFEISRQFMDVSGVHWAGMNPMLGDGPDISVELYSDHLLYTFSLGWGDCPAGCIYEHLWDFKVYKNGDVKFAGERGEPIPEAE